MSSETLKTRDWEGNKQHRCEADGMAAAVSKATRALQSEINTLRFRYEQVCEDNLKAIQHQEVLRAQLSEARRPVSRFAYIAYYLRSDSTLVIVAVRLSLREAMELNPSDIKVFALDGMVDSEYHAERRRVATLMGLPKNLRGEFVDCVDPVRAHV